MSTLFGLVRYNKYNVNFFSVYLGLIVLIRGSIKLYFNRDTYTSMYSLTSDILEICLNVKDVIYRRIDAV